LLGDFIMLKKWVCIIIFLAGGHGVLAAETILVMGDSLSAAYGLSPQQGWVHLLAQRLSDQSHQVINASVSGETTSGGLARLPAALKKFKPTIVILELGGNDGLHNLGLAVMRSNLAQMIEQSQQAKAKVILIGMKMPSNYGKQYSQKFQNVFIELSKKYSTAFVPFLLEGLIGHPQFVQEDGLHPTAIAQPIILETVWQVLKDMLPIQDSIHVQPSAQSAIHAE